MPILPCVDSEMKGGLCFGIAVSGALGCLPLWTSPISFPSQSSTSTYMPSAWCVHEAGDIPRLCDGRGRAHSGGCSGRVCRHAIGRRWRNRAAVLRCLYAGGGLVEHDSRGGRSTSSYFICRCTPRPLPDALLHLLSSEDESVRVTSRRPSPIRDSACRMRENTPALTWPWPLPPYILRQLLRRRQLLSKARHSYSPATTRQYYTVVKYTTRSLICSELDWPGELPTSAQQARTSSSSAGASHSTTTHQRISKLRPAGVDYGTTRSSGVGCPRNAGLTASHSFLCSIRAVAR